jgi:hypothetical protein
MLGSLLWSPVPAHRKPFARIAAVRGRRMVERNFRASERWPCPGARLHRGAAPRRAQKGGSDLVVSSTAPVRDEVPEGYRLMNEREALKVQIAF